MGMLILKSGTHKNIQCRDCEVFVFPGAKLEGCYFIDCLFVESEGVTFSCTFDSCLGEYNKMFPENKGK